MRTTPHALLVILFLLVGVPLIAQQPAKTKSKTQKGNTRNNRDTTQMSADTAAMRTDNTTMQGGGGGVGTGAAMPYTAGYSSQFTIGNPEHARMVLQVWRDYEDNRLDQSGALLADSIVFEAASGQVIKGRDSVLGAFKQMRNQYTNVKQTVDVYLPIRSTDRNEDWVLIWGREEDTNANGTTTNIIHEIWRINRDGKIDYMSQYVAKPPTQ